MGLKDIIIETDSVEYAGQSIPLRGICPNDIKVILTRNRLSAEMLFNLADRKGVKGMGDLTEDKIKGIANSAITELPTLVANVIAQCSDDIESADIVECLPAPVQFDCLRKIARLTFTDATNFGEFLGNVMATVQTMGKLSPKVTNEQAAALLQAGGTVQ